MPKPVKFKSVLTVATPESGWHYIPVAWTIGEKFPKNGGTRRVLCTINGVETFPCALMPYEGEFTIVVNKDRRKKLGILAGDKISVEIAADESEHGMPMPEELQEVLNQDSEGEAAFAAMTPGKRRSMMFYIGKIKDVDLRIHTALIFVEHIKKNNGQVNLPLDELKRYLTGNISYTIDEGMQAGLELYFELAFQHGLIERNRPLEFTGRLAENA